MNLVRSIRADNRSYWVLAHQVSHFQHPQHYENTLHQKSKSVRNRPSKQSAVTRKSGAKISFLSHYRPLPLVKSSIPISIVGHGSACSGSVGMRTWEMLFGILLTSLGRLADLLPNDFPLVVFVLFDSVHKRLRLIFSELSVVHILVPVLLHRSFCPRREGLGNLSPTVARISHLLQA